MATVRTLIGYVKGPKGDTGATGATGAQGPAGQDGAPGVNDYATTEAAGLVRVGTDLKIDGNNGTLSIKNAFTRASTLAKTVSEEAFATSLGKIAKAVDWVVDNAPNFFNKSTDIVDGFTSSLTNKALSANAGKILKTQLDTLSDSLSGIGVYHTQVFINGTSTPLPAEETVKVGEITLDKGLYIAETFIRFHGCAVNGRLSQYVGTATSIANNTTGQSTFFVGNAQTGYFGSSYTRPLHVNNDGTKINVLLLAIGGGNYDSARLTWYKVANL